jgi:rubredoxin
MRLAAPPASRFNRASFVERRLSPAMKAYMCVICGYVYEEEKGDPVAGIPPGTRWEDVPLSWRCPDCGAGKEDFEMVEV